MEFLGTIWAFSPRRRSDEWDHGKLCSSLLLVAVSLRRFRHPIFGDFSPEMARASLRQVQPKPLAWSLRDTVFSAESCNLRQLCQRLSKTATTNVKVCQHPLGSDRKTTPHATFELLHSLQEKSLSFPSSTSFRVCISEIGFGFTERSL